MEQSPASPIDLQSRIEQVEAACRRYQRQAAIAINLLARDPHPRNPAPLILPLPAPDLLPEASASLRYNLEEREFDGHRVRLTGWAHLGNAPVDREPAEIVLFFRVNAHWWLVATAPVLRPDVAQAFSLPDDSPPKGFEAHFRIPQPHARLTALRLMVATTERRDFSPELTWG